MDIHYLNIACTFYYICTVLDGYSRAVVHWEIREQMKEQDVEVILQRAREAVPGAMPRVITDNGPQFVAREFKVFIMVSGMTHVRTSPFYPQSKGKIERWHKSLKTECLRPKTPISLVDARRIVTGFVEQYNTQRLHSAIGYITPAAKLAGKAPAIFAFRQQRLEKPASAVNKCGLDVDTPPNRPVFNGSGFNLSAPDQRQAEKKNGRDPAELARLGGTGFSSKQSLMEQVAR